MIKKVPVSIPFTKGVDTKTDEKLTMSPTEIINAKIGKQGIIKKVNGVKVESKTTDQAADLQNATHVSTFSNSTLVGADGGIYEKAQNVDEWTLASDYVFNNVSSDFIDSRESFDPSYVEGDIYSLYSTGGTVLIKNKTTGRTTKEVSFSGTNNIMAIQNGQSIGFIRFNSNNLYWTKVTNGEPGLEVLVSSYTGTVSFSAKTSTNGAYIFYSNVDVRVIEINDAGVIQNTSTLFNSVASSTSMCVDSDGLNVHVFYANIGSSLFYYEVLSLDLQTSVTNYSCDGFNPNSLGDTFSSVRGTISISDSGVFAFYQGDNTTSNSLFIGSVLLTPSLTGKKYYSTESAIGPDSSHQLLASKGFSYGPYSFAMFESISSLDRKVFVVDSSLNVQAIVFNSNYGGKSNFIFSEIKTYNGVIKFTFPSSGKGQLLFELDFDDPTIKSIAHTNVKIYNGGNPLIYDGQSFFPASFIADPSVIALSENGVGSFSGTYDYKVVHSSIDNKGNVYRSTDSSKRSIGIGATASSIDVTVNVPLEAMSDQEGGLFYMVEIYRKESAETVYRNIKESDSKIYAIPNNGALESIEITDNIENNSGNEALYVTDATSTTLRNSTLPPLRDIFWNNGRIFGISALDNEIVYSRKYVIGEGINFPLEFSFIVEDNQTLESEEIEAIGAMDSKLIIFKKSSILALYGDGPDNNGENDSFSDPEIISTDAGSTNPLSIVLTGRGLFFQSNKGIYQLDRSLSLTFKGKDVEGISGSPIVSALTNQIDDEVVFHTKDGHEIIYNYFYDAWSWAAYKGSFVSATSLDGKIVTLDADGQVMTENDTFRKGNDFIEQSFNTGWLKLNGIQDFQRVSKLIFNGEYVDDHQVKINVFYDYDNSSSDEYLISPTIGELYQFSVHLKRQKCQAMRVKVTCVDTGTTGEGFRMSDMTILAGIRKGLNKLSNGNKY